MSTSLADHGFPSVFNAIRCLRMCIFFEAGERSEMEDIRSVLGVVRRKAQNGASRCKSQGQFYLLVLWAPLPRMLGYCNPLILKNSCAWASRWSQRVRRRRDTNRIVRERGSSDGLVILGLLNLVKASDTPNTETLYWLNKTLARGERDLQLDSFTNKTIRQYLL